MVLVFGETENELEVGHVAGGGSEADGFGVKGRPFGLRISLPKEADFPFNGGLILLL